DDRAPPVAVSALGDRIPRTARARALVRVETFARAPAPVDARLARRRVVDLFVRVLADVADPDVAGRAVEGEPPRVAQAPHPGLAHCAGTRDERIVLRHAVRRVANGRRVDAQDLRQGRGKVLPV